MKKITIHLDAPYEIQELTVGQIEDIQAILGVGAPEGSTVQLSKDSNRSLLEVALSVDHPEITREVIARMRVGTFRKINEAVTAVLEFGGFIAKKGAAKSGEAEAGA